MEKIKSLTILLYSELRDYGLTAYLKDLERLVVLVNNSDFKGIRKLKKSRVLNGGAGSLRDLDINDKVFQKKIKPIITDFFTELNKY